jgi:hypothetical protein
MTTFCDHIKRAHFYLVEKWCGLWDLYPVPKVLLAVIMTLLICLVISHLIKRK